MLKENIFGEVFLRLGLHKSGQSTENEFINEIKAMIIEGVTPPKHRFTYFGSCADQCIIGRYLVGRAKLPEHMKDVKGYDDGVRYIVWKKATKKDLETGENVYCFYGNIKED